MMNCKKFKYIKFSCLIIIGCVFLASFSELGTEQAEAGPDLIFPNNSHLNNSDDTILKISSDSILRRLQEELIQAKARADKDAEATIYDKIGEFYSSISVNDSAIIYFKKALETGMSINYKKFFPYLSQIIANKYWDLGEYYEALGFALRAEEFHEKEGTLEDNEYLINLLGIIYLKLKDYSEAYDYFQHAIRISERKKNYSLLGVIYSNIGNIYFEQGQYAESKINFEKGLALEEENGMFQNAGRSYVSIAKTDLALKDPVSAEEHLNKALKYNQITSDIEGFTRTYFLYGKLYEFLKKYNLSFEYLDKAKSFAQKTGSREHFMNIYESFSIVYQKINDSNKALYYQHLYDSLYKEVYSIQDFTDIKRLENDLRLERQNNEFNKYKIEKQRAVQILLITGIFLSVTISVLFMVLYRRTKKSRKILLAKNIEINEQKDILNKTNIELEKAKRNAEAANELKSSFLHNLSHEIRTPLNAILGFSELLQSTNPSGEEAKYYFEQIGYGKDDLINLVDNIVLASQIETNQFSFSRDKFMLSDSLSKLAKDSEKLLKRTGKHHIEFTTQFDQVKDLTIEADERIIIAALRQLIENAIKFTDSGKIELGANLISCSEVEFYVIDTGIGIDPSEFGKIFERFYKIESGSDRLFRGAGIGLTIVKGIAELKGGEVCVTSKPGEGSAFYFKIPVKII